MGPESAAPPPNPGSTKSPLEYINTGKRYDVYCIDKDKAEVVYRNVLFKGRRRLSSTEQTVTMGEFLELEQSNGQTVYVPLHLLRKFCEHGTEITGENLPPK